MFIMFSPSRQPLKLYPHETSPSTTLNTRFFSSQRSCFFDHSFKMSPESVNAREDSNCSSFFGALRFHYEVYIFFIKGIFHGRPSLLLKVGQFIKECLLLITKSLKIQDKLILIQNKSFFGIQKFFKSLAAFLESIVLLLEILNHKLFDCGMWHIYHIGSYEMIIVGKLGKERIREKRRTVRMPSG